MLNNILKISFFSCLLFPQSIFAAGMEPKKELLMYIQSETKKCAVQTGDSSNNEKEEIVFTSACASLRIISKSEAQILIEGEWLRATISESSESDGGDLDDLLISDSKGKILARKTNVPAYDNVIFAMVGASEH